MAKPLENNKPARSVFVGLVFLLVIVVGVYFLWALFSSQPSIQAAIIALLASIGSLVLSRFFQQQREFKEAHRGKKVEIYNHFVDLMIDVLSGERDKKPITEKQIIKRIEPITKGLILYSSAETIRYFNDFKFTSQNNKNPGNMIPIVGNLLIAMRNDIGLDNRNLSSIDVVQIFLNERYKEEVSQHEHP